jgi:DNA topoisomerase-2
MATDDNKYQWLSAREHVLKRSEMYAGSVTPCEQCTHTMCLVDGRVTRRDVTTSFSPALLKVSDEVVVNACDNIVRCPMQRFIKARFGEDGVFEVENDGATIPVAHWPGTTRFIAEILFGEMMSGENFDDENGRTGGGLNGVGVKITGILSTWLELKCVSLAENQLFYECSDDCKRLLGAALDGAPPGVDEAPEHAVQGLSFHFLSRTGKCTPQTIIGYKGRFYRNVGAVVYSQRFEDNLRITHPPKLRKPTAKERTSSTTVRWQVDLERLSTPRPIEADVLAVLRTRMFEVAACYGESVGVYVDGCKLPVRNLKDYASALGAPFVAREFVERENTRLEVCLAGCAEAREACVVGFVNGIRCSAGTHIEAVWRKLCDALSAMLQRRMKRPVAVKKEQLRARLVLVVGVTMVNPTFATQTKEKLDTPAARLGLNSFELSAATLRALDRHGVVDELQTLQEQDDVRTVQRSVKTERSRTQAIPKYEKALKLASKEPCSLYITEGDSAKALAVAGFSVVGREQNGVFPLRGKLLNVNGMSAKRALENKEIMYLTQILGLDPCVLYTRETALRLPYRHLVIFTDQDTDGSHIAGLILNWMRAMHSSLLRALPDFVHRFVTPIIRAKLGSETHSFFTQQEYQEWVQTGIRPAAVKYYKGLGTSTSEDARVYFNSIDRHRFAVRYTGPDCDAAIDAFFATSKTDVRKQLLDVADPTSYIHYAQDDVTFQDICHKELVMHGLADNRRSIASAMDGLKPSQRKILHVALTRGGGECKVAQLAAAVAERTAYHHGEKSLVQAMVAMAQPWMGACNIALLRPNGMFGSRHDVRSEHSAERYIYTEKHPIAALLFPPEDQPVLEYLEDDARLVEPKHFVPVIPFVLVNGADGIGTGWRSNCPAFCPRDVLANVRRLVADEAAALAPMTPTYVGFEGTTHSEDGEWVFAGRCEIETPTTVRITELPPRMWTAPYIEMVRKDLIGDKSTAFVHSIEDHSLGESVRLHVKLKAPLAPETTEAELVLRLKLRCRVQMRHLNLFSADGDLFHFGSVDEIMRCHAHERRTLYSRRIRVQIEKMTQDEQVAIHKARFVREVRAGELDVRRMSKSTLEETLRASGYPEMDGGFKYLSSIGLFALTRDVSESLEAEAKRLAETVSRLRATTAESMWQHELDRFETGLALYEEEQRLLRDNTPPAKKNKKRTGAAVSRRKPSAVPRL